jgi:UDP:flavonoid glycosyltransferase YjiC (YdhE family)
MRVLVSTTSGSGHWMPIVPVMRALVDAGHHVVVGCPASAADRITARGFEVRPFADVEGPAPEQVALFARAAETGDPSFAQQAVTLGFGYLSPSAAMPGLTETWESFGPEVVVRDPGEFASLMLAEQRGTPSVVAAGGLLSALAYFSSLVVAPTDRLRSDHGIGPGDPTSSTELYLTATPPTFDEVGGVTTPVHRFGLGLPRAPIPTADPPLVYATLGTEMLQIDDMAERVVDTIAGAIDLLDARCILTVGGKSARFAGMSDRVEVRAFVDHGKVIPSARAVITHGGAGTVQDALHMGRPMVVLPQFADQFQNGARVAELGLGSCLVSEAQTPQAVCRALGEALEGRHDRAVAEIADEVAALPPASSVVPLLEALVR